MLGAMDVLARLSAVPWSHLQAAEVVPIVARVLSGAAAEREIDRFLRHRPSLGRNERSAAVEAIFGVGLWRRRLAWHAGSTDPRTLLFALLRDLAGVDEATAAHLCDLPRPWPMRRPAPSRLADRFSLPDFLEELLLRDLGPEAEPFAQASCVPGPICLRANALRTTREDLAGRLRDEGVDTVPTTRARHGLVVTTPRPNLLSLDSLREGLFEVQDEGSQLVAESTRARPGETVLDFCAGAGGKTLALAAMMRNQGHLVACDPDAGRLGRLAARARRAGASVEIPDRPPGHLQADAVLVDAPCSELGVLRRGPDVRFRIHEEELRALPGLQREILEAALPFVRPGGRIVYATCTIRSEENDEVAWAFERDHPALVRDGPFFRTFPHREGTDGFFAARWRVARGCDAAS
jgi:16S rRNA (cytosine967-C5)-methyltransferase